jgi:hypothetical protein
MTDQPKSRIAAQIIFDKLIDCPHPVAVFIGKSRIVEFCNPALPTFEMRCKRDIQRLIGVYDVNASMPDMVADCEAAGMV